MDRDTKIIFALLALMAVLTGVFVLKVAGVIKLAENNNIKENTIDEPNFDLKTEENIINEPSSDSKQEKNDIYEEDEDFLIISKLDIDMEFFIRWYSTLVMMYRVFIFIVTIILSIGISMMYKKIEMPIWTVVLQFGLPFLNLINILAIETIIYILRFISLILLYKKLEALRIEINLHNILFIGTIIMILFIVLINSNLNIINSLVTMLVALIVIFAVMFHIKMSSNLAEVFYKGNGFKIGLIFLPTIFQAILGYQKN